MDVACDPHPRVSRRSWILLLTLSALWGSSYLFIKLALEDDVSPAVIVSVRTALAALVLLPLAAHRGALGGLRANVAPILLLAVVQMGGPLLLIAAGEQHISSSLTGILVATAPIFTFLLAFAQEGQERASGLSLGGVAIGIGGVALLLGLDTSGGAALAGGLMVVAASFGYGIGGWVVKRQVRDVQPVAMVGATASVAALLTAPAALLSLPSHAPGFEAVSSLLLLGVLFTGAASRQDPVARYRAEQRQGVRHPAPQAAGELASGQALGRRPGAAVLSGQPRRGVLLAEDLQGLGVEQVEILGRQRT